MNKIYIEKSARLRSLAAAGWLIAVQGATAADVGEKANFQAQSESEPNNNPSAQVEFSEVDVNGDNLVSWQELAKAYERNITKVGLTEDQFIRDFDRNRDLALDQVEYRAFTTGLMERQVYSAAEINDQSLQKTQQAQQSADTKRGDLPRQQEQAVNAPHPDQNAVARQPEQDHEVAATEDQPTGQEALKPDTQIQQQQAEQQIQQSDTVVAIVGVTAVQNVPVADIANRQVINLEGKKIGDVEEVVRSEDGATTGLVVSMGGFFGMGAKEVVIDVHEVHLTEDKVVWEETEESAVDDLPEYNEKDYVSVR